MFNKKCICIKDGFMNSGRQFCLKGKVYWYHSSETRESENYYVDTDGTDRIHSMSYAFFHEYFGKKDITYWIEDTDWKI